MDLGLKNKTALVLGGGGGLGRAIAKALAIAHSEPGDLECVAAVAGRVVETLSREVAGDGITANIILPGRIATDRITFLDESKARREGRTREEVQAESTCAIPMNRYGKPEEYGEFVAFLARERASYMTGSVIRVDGGLIAGI